MAAACPPGDAQGAGQRHQTVENDRTDVHFHGGFGMLLLIIRLVFAIICAGAVASYVYDIEREGTGFFARNPIVTCVLLFGFTQLIVVGDLLLKRKRIEIISAVYFGLLIGVLLGYLLVQGLEPLIYRWEYRNGVYMLITLIVPYICISFLLQTKDDFRFIIPYVEFAREVKGGNPWILDSSALIDGRIGDLVETNVIDAEMIVPQFVLREVQDIADSSDKIRRARGRRGLDVLNKLQNTPKADIRVQDTESRDGGPSGDSVDQKLVELAKQINGHIVTNDFNLNKVASVQGISVINLNDVANALKPRYLPGERVLIKIIKEGETPGQGVGYLDDGTMVVCEQSSHLMGKDVDVIVTSVLQSSAGRMIFGRQVHNAQSANAGRA